MKFTKIMKLTPINWQITFWSSKKDNSTSKTKVIIQCIEKQNGQYITWILNIFIFFGNTRSYVTISIDR